MSQKDNFKHHHDDILFTTFRLSDFFIFFSKQEINVLQP